MPEQLSKIERRILDYLIEYLRRNTYQPSIREIGRRFGIKSTKTVSEYLQALADKGYIEREASRSRGVRILSLDLQPSRTVRVPVYGEIAAGAPQLLRESADEEFALDPKIAGSPDAFFLVVEGESMEAIGILDGDHVLVEPVSIADLRDGEVVAARIGARATVKRYFQREGQVVLEPANVSYPPILVGPDDDFAVLGRVTGLFRRFTEEHTRTVDS